MKQQLGFPSASPVRKWAVSITAQIVLFHCTVYFKSQAEEYS